MKIDLHEFESEGRELEACKLTIDQRYNIENQLRRVIQEKLLLVAENFQDSSFLLKHEHLRGQIVSYQWLLALDDNARGRIAEA